MGNTFQKCKAGRSVLLAREDQQEAEETYQDNNLDYFNMVHSPNTVILSKRGNVVTSQDDDPHGDHFDNQIDEDDDWVYS